ncbi:LOW QUALITY PROTEIN: aquaporin-1-like [Erpetoichthys calabaricus]|nr:LOW QUALITY PROTEIN: aquaporin-1-like [Erpetoichthys calabaricus]
MAKEFRSKAFWRAVVAELLGMTVFVFISIMAAIPSGNGAGKEVKVSLAFGLAIATLAQSLGHISGAHLNPAVTFGLLTSCQISVFKAVMYMFAQILGATMASGLIYGINPNSSIGLNQLNETQPGQALAIELFATFQLVLCVLAVTDKRRRDVFGGAPLAIGLSVALGHLGAISYTGCGINPARSFGPALIKNNFTDHWVFWVGPMIGGVMAALVYDFILYPKTEDLPDRMKVLMNGQDGEYDVNDTDETTRVEMSSK